MSWDIRHFFFAQNGAQEPPSEDKKNNQNEQEKTRLQETTPWKIIEQMKAPIKISLRLDYKRRMQIKISGHSHEQQIEFQSTARDPPNFSAQRAGWHLKFKRHWSRQNASFRKPAGKRGLRRIFCRLPALLLEPGTNVSICRAMLPLWREHKK